LFKKLSQEMLRLIIFFSFLISGNVSAQHQGDLCIKTNGKQNQPGVCEFIKDCPSAKADFDRGIRPQICSFVGQQSIVCCVKETKSGPLPTSFNNRRVSVEKCEIYKNSIIKRPSFTNNPLIKIMECRVATSTSLIVGGVTTKTGDFPHMAAIGYENFNEIRFKCGGSLISEKFILTAAHCLRWPPWRRGSGRGRRL
jgi:hypothetical protein